MTLSEMYSFVWKKPYKSPKQMGGSPLQSSITGIGSLISYYVDLPLWCKPFGGRTKRYKKKTYLKWYLTTAQDPFQSKNQET